MDTNKLQNLNSSQFSSPYFNLRFERASRTYYTDENIQGFVDVDDNLLVDVEKVCLLFRGETLACWCENEQSALQQKTIRAHKCYWRDEIIILPKSESIVITKGNGRTSLPFHVQLPDDQLPSSFESKYGAIRYWVKASIVPGTLNCQQPFTVLEKIDINLKKYKKKVSSFSEKLLSWMCFRYGGISLTASLDRSGYCPGEAIAINCRGNNKANRDMGGLKARLIQTIHYATEDNDKTKDCETILRAIGGNRIARNHTRVWQNQLLWIPNVPPTNNCSRHIIVKYHIQVTMQIPNDTDLEVSLPVIIGTMPRLSNIDGDAPRVDLTKFEKCTDGSDCFNRSSKRYQFPMQPFIPSTCVLQDFVFQSYEKNGVATKTMGCEERQPLLQRNL